MPGAFVFIDGIAHYTTDAQADTKWTEGATPQAGAGAYGTAAVRPEGGPLGLTENLGTDTIVELIADVYLVSQTGQWMEFYNATAGKQILVTIYNTGAIEVRNGQTGGQLAISAANAIRFGVQEFIYIKLL